MQDKEILVITGLSGSGKSTAIKAFEDMGFLCIDNLPVGLLKNFMELCKKNHTKEKHVALGMDTRDNDYILHFPGLHNKLKSEGWHIKIIFIEADDEILIQRFSQTRRQHPFFMLDSISDAIREERKKLNEIRKIADKIINTSHLNIHQLKTIIKEMNVGKDRFSHLHILITSFGFKYGIPAETNLLFDVRFIPNPYFNNDLCPLNGHDTRVKKFIVETKEYKNFAPRLINIILYLLPLYEKEGKAYINIAFGCTGGKHRSVMIAEMLRDLLCQHNFQATLVDRDINKDNTKG